MLAATTPECRPGKRWAPAVHNRVLQDILDGMLCTDCQSGYHAPYDRFERVATNPDAPSFLMRCRQCAALWNENSGPPHLLTQTQARWLYPAVRI